MVGVHAFNPRGRQSLSLSQPGEFQDSQGYREKLCHEKQNKTNKQNEVCVDDRLALKARDILAGDRPKSVSPFPGPVTHSHISSASEPVGHLTPHFQMPRQSGEGLGPSVSSTYHRLLHPLAPLAPPCEPPTFHKPAV